MPCSKCRRPAIIFQRYSGLHLCRSHFVADFESKAKRAIRQHRWITPGDRIGVAMSGGKDSSALLHFLVKLLGKRHDISLVAFTIDEGIQGYRDCMVARRIAEGLGVEHIPASFEDYFGITVDQIVGKKGDRLSCSYCGVLRRQLLNRVAKQHGITRLALGFNLDDEAQSVLMNVLRGDADRLLRPSGAAEGLVPRIKPFMYIPEREVALYALLHIEGFEIGRCPYSHNALRADVRNLLNDYAWRHPATRYSLVNLGERLSGIGGDVPAAAICESCGEPFIGECRTCRMLSEVLDDLC
ncbi:MAG: TIGR00269 family protein [Methanomicrobiales archaeon]|nr:TIGR00269 family protein [Methanomicrobiales archaeon]NYT20299.1 TIGR00269 family protein [Methanomicrobiales archaeon]